MLDISLCAGRSLYVVGTHTDLAFVKGTARSAPCTPRGVNSDVQVDAGLGLIHAVLASKSYAYRRFDGLVCKLYVTYYIWQFAQKLLLFLRH